MLQVRRSQDRGYFDHGWLKTFHTFSFGHYYDPNQRGFRNLRVINEDWVAPGKGFGEHGHDNMEIVTVVLEGQLQHRDSLGSGEILTPVDVQRMSAGSGIRHSEFNPSSDQPVHLYQIWLHPREENLEPSYEQQAFAADERKNKWQTLVSPDRREGSLAWQTDAVLLRTELSTGQELTHSFAEGRSGWLQVVKGTLDLGDETLVIEGDGVAITDETLLRLVATEHSDVLLFDLA